MLAARLCKRLGIMEDLKAGVPRTGYHGVVMIRSHGRRVFIAPSYRATSWSSSLGCRNCRRFCDFWIRFTIA